MVRKCCIESCLSSEADDNNSFFKFPIDDGQLASWYLSIFSETGQTDFREDDNICSEHFSPKNFIHDSNGSLTLNPTAVPFSYAQEVPARRIKQEQTNWEIQCCLFSCPNVKRDTQVSKPEVVYHPFPTDPIVLERWKMFCNILENDPEFNYLCSEHFTTNDYKNFKANNALLDNITVLKANACPTICSRAEIKVEEPEISTDVNAGPFLNNSFEYWPGENSLIRGDDSLDGNVSNGKITAKRRALDISEKITIIRAIKNGETNVDISKRLGVARSTISTIWKNRDQIMEALVSKNTKLKKNRPATKPDIESALLTWFKMQRSLNMFISTQNLKEKALFFAKELGDTTFQCSNSWLARFRVRNNIRLGKPPADGSATVCATNQTVTSDWLQNVWPYLRFGYKDDDIYNADECGLLFRLLPDNVLAFRGEICSNGESAKDRVTIVVCSNMSGTDKRKLVVIGKPSKSQFCRNVVNLPVNYFTQKSAWMTVEIFEKALLQWDLELSRQNRHILLIIDNCSAHPFVKNLNNIKLVFLPPDSTSVIQPMGQSVIFHFKSNYRKLLLLRILEDADGSENVSKLSILEAVRLFDRAWQMISESTIKNAFIRSGFSEEPPLKEEYNFSLRDWLNAYNFHSLLHSPGIEYYETVDDNLKLFPDESDESILNAIKSSTTSQNYNEDDINGDMTNKVEQGNSKAASRALQVLRNFYETNPVEDTRFLQYIDYIETVVDRFRIKDLQKVEHH